MSHLYTGSHNTSLFFICSVFQLFSHPTQTHRYYYSETKPTEASLVMDDFSYHGWKMSNSVYNLSLDHILCAG